MTKNAPDPGPEFEADLRLAASGDQDARQRLWSKYYDVLRDCAKVWLAKAWPDQGHGAAISLGGTEILHAAYERLHQRTAALEDGQRLFFKAFYTECVRIAIDHFRKKKSKGERVEFDEERMAPSSAEDEEGSQIETIAPETLIAILSELEREDPEVGRVAMMKIYERRPVDGHPGRWRRIENSEIAEQLGIAVRTVEKYWEYAKARIAAMLRRREK